MDEIGEGVGEGVEGWVEGVGGVGVVGEDVEEEDEGVFAGGGIAVVQVVNDSADAGGGGVDLREIIAPWIDALVGEEGAQVGVAGERGTEQEGGVQVGEQCVVYATDVGLLAADGAFLFGKMIKVSADDGLGVVNLIQNFGREREVGIAD